MPATEAAECNALVGERRQGGEASGEPGVER